MASSETRKMTPPYIPFQTFETFIGHLHETAVPAHIDKTLMPSFSGAVQSHVMSAIRFLGLVKGDDDETTEALRRLVKAYQTDGYPDTLGSIITAAYSGIVDQIDISTATQKSLESAFRDNAGVNGTMLGRIVRFYVGALKAAGVEHSPHFGRRKPRRAALVSKKPKSPARKRAESRLGVDSQENDPPRTRRYPLFFKDKAEGAIIVPEDLSAADCKVIELQLAVLRAYAEGDEA